MVKSKNLIVLKTFAKIIPISLKDIPQMRYFLFILTLIKIIASE